MVINISLYITHNELSIDYRPIILSLFKTVLNRHYPTEYKNLYENGAEQKDFTFAVRFKNPVFSNEKITFSDPNIYLSISSDDEFCSMLFYNAFQKSIGYSHPLNDCGRMTVMTVHINPQPKLKLHTAVIKFLSPLVIRKHIDGEADRYFIYGDDDFQDCLKQVIERQIGKAVEINIEPISPRKTVVRSFGVKIRCSLGTYRITIEPEILDKLSRSGLGSRRGEGFGYFIVVGG